jgi:hypothetical protein
MALASASQTRRKSPNTKLVLVGVRLSTVHVIDESRKPDCCWDFVNCHGCQSVKGRFVASAGDSSSFIFQIKGLFLKSSDMTDSSPVMTDSRVRM